MFHPALNARMERRRQFPSPSTSTGMRSILNILWKNTSFFSRMSTRSCSDARIATSWSSSSSSWNIWICFIKFPTRCRCLLVHVSNNLDHSSPIWALEYKGIAWFRCWKESRSKFALHHHTNHVVCKDKSSSCCAWGIPFKPHNRVRKGVNSGSSLSYDKHATSAPYLAAST